MTDEVFATRSDRRRIVAWGLWDWGSAAYNAVIVTFIFSVYLVDGVGDDVPGPFRAATWLGLSSAAGAVLIAVLAPALGRLTDAGGRRKRSLMWVTGVVGGLTAAPFFVEGGRPFLWLGLTLVAGGSGTF